MPTGFTAYVADGTVTSLRDFALLCARGMGATITMRDAPIDQPIPEAFAISTWNQEQLAKASARIAELKAMSLTDAGQAAQYIYSEEFREWEKSGQENAQRQARYKAMLNQVEAWTGAPEGIREFMLEQLRSSMSFDDYKPEQPRLLTGDEWHKAALNKAEWDHSYHAKSHAEEVARVGERNAWLKQLRESLPEA